MSNGYRFGRRMPLPSTREILHELRMLQSAERIALLEQQLKSLSTDAVPAEASTEPRHPEPGI